MAFEGNTWINYVVFSLFAVIAFFGNSLVIYVLVTRPVYLKKSYNIFILNLAVIDCFTAIFLVFSRFLYLPPTPNYDVIAGEVFCRTIWSAWIAFCLGYISVYTCLVLTIERWLAVARPHTYRAIKPKHAALAVIFVWVWGPAVNATTLFRAKYIAAKQRCTWTKLLVANNELPWMDLTLQTLLPFALMVGFYCHIYHIMRKLPHMSSTQNAQKKITIVALAASLALIIGWLPGRITFMMTKFKILDANGVTNITCVMLTFFNSCVNPFLYGVYSSQFREEYIAIFRKLSRFPRNTATVSAVGQRNQETEMAAM